MRPARCINVHQNTGPGATIPDPGSSYSHPRPQPRKTPLMTCSKVCFSGRKLPAPLPLEGRNLRLHRISQDYPILHSITQLYLVIAPLLPIFTQPSHHAPVLARSLQDVLLYCKSILASGSLPEDCFNAQLVSS